MRMVGPWILLTLYLIALVRPLAPILDYQVNRDFFAEVLCINKAKPELKCNGQCALTQKLKQAQSDETQPVSAQNIIKLDDYPIGFISLYSNSSEGNGSQSKRHSDVSFEIVISGYLSEIFRPPCAA
jgi:hypothetical protein